MCDTGHYRVTIVTLSEVKHSVTMAEIVGNSLYLESKATITAVCYIITTHGTTFIVAQIYRPSFCKTSGAIQMLGTKLFS